VPNLKNPFSKIKTVFLKIICSSKVRGKNEQHSGVYLEINGARSGIFDKEICRANDF
jgi:hypothetical protein